MLTERFGGDADVGGQPLTCPSLVIRAKAPFLVCAAECDCSTWHPDVRAFYDFVQGCAPPDRHPGRQHLDPALIPKLLPSVWLIDFQRAPYRFRFRLVGTRLGSILKREVTGQWLDEAHSPSPELNIVMSRFEMMATEGVVTYRPPTPATLHNRDYINFEDVAIPLARDGREIDMIAGFTSVTLGKSGRPIGLYG